MFARIEYPLILDDIFSYLGGFSFQEKVEQEIKTDAKEGVTYAKYKLQSKKLSIQTCYAAKQIFGENTKSVWIVKNIKHFYGH